MQSCLPYFVVYTNVFHYGHNNGEDDSVYTISNGDGGSIITSAAVNGQMVAAGEGGWRRKSATLCR